MVPCMNQQLSKPSCDWKFCVRWLDYLGIFVSTPTCIINMSITAQQQLMLCKTKYRKFVSVGQHQRAYFVAEALLEDVFAKHRQGEERFKQLDYMATVGSTQYSCNVILTESLDKPHKARTAIQTKIHSSGRTNLIYPLESNEDEVEELVLSLQGYAAVCNLPPITTTDQ